MSQTQLTTQVMHLQSANSHERIEALRNAGIQRVISEPAAFERFVVAADLLLRSDAIRACTPASILGGLLACVRFGFDPSPELGHCYLIPRRVNNEMVAVFQIGYRGWANMVKAAGLATYITGEAVYGQDEFDFELGTNGFLRHKPSLGAKLSETPIAYYVEVLLPNGQKIHKVITREESEQARRFSESQYTGYKDQKVFSATPVGFWAKGYTAMALRRPMKEICKGLLGAHPMITEAVQYDESVTLVNKQGETVTIPPNEVASQAEPLPDQPLTEREAHQLDEVIAALAEKNNLIDIAMFFEDMLASDYKDRREFIMPFIQRAAQVADSMESLVSFYEFFKKTKWGQDKEVLQIMATARKRIESQNPTPIEQ